MIATGSVAGIRAGYAPLSAATPWRDAWNASGYAKRFGMFINMFASVPIGFVFRGGKDFLWRGSISGIGEGFKAGFKPEGGNYSDQEVADFFHQENELTSKEVQLEIALEELEKAAGVQLGEVADEKLELKRESHVQLNTRTEIKPDIILQEICAKKEADLASALSTLLHSNLELKQKKVILELALQANAEERYKIQAKTKPWEAGLNLHFAKSNFCAILTHYVFVFPSAPIGLMARGARDFIWGMGAFIEGCTLGFKSQNGDYSLAEKQAKIEKRQQEIRDTLKYSENSPGRIDLQYELDQLSEASEAQMSVEEKEQRATKRAEIQAKLVAKKYRAGTKELEDELEYVKEVEENSFKAVINYHIRQKNVGALPTAIIFGSVGTVIGFAARGIYNICYGVASGVVAGLQSGFHPLGGKSYVRTNC